ncbi:MAG: TIGR00159 family protein [Candidatus Paraimprobicoccus trichonymphae]|uniref:Diadenylate cyclase n=1 Tax=Candidatus Paraimprobicoccus trichonymphae TaxID=3033793 RepID=A0AA48I5K7_9FIRM|nr:MAG: TIGR00159 family protein [Candidatus Paraimprobicoccus trichonymphae]
MENLYNLFNFSIIFSLIKTFSFSDFFDVLIVSFFIYQFIKFIRETQVEQFIKGIFVFILIYILSYNFKFKMLITMLNNFSQFGVLAILVLFQPELRKVLEKIGRSNLGSYWDINNILKKNYSKIKIYKKIINITINLTEVFQKSKTGALIVFERKTKLGDFVSTGIILKAQYSFELLANIFYNKAPLHDGAVIVKDNFIYSASCILPLSKNLDLNNEFGTRHRAALGISEISDCVVLTVSEETGNIHIVQNGVLTKVENKEILKKKLEKILIREKEHRINFIMKNLRKENKNDRDKKDI